MTTFPAPVIPAFPAGYGPLQSDFATWWQNNVSFLQTRVVARLRQAVTATSLPTSGVAQNIAFDTVDEDPYGGFTGGRWQPPAGYSGWYQLTASVVTNGLVAAGAGLQIRTAGFYTINMAKTVGPIGHSAAAEGQASVYLIGGQDAIGIAAALLNGTSAVSTSLTAGQQSYMNVTWLGLN